jgi:hypothetical protein
MEADGEFLLLKKLIPNPPSAASPAIKIQQSIPHASWEKGFTISAMISMFYQS